jgi:hypothetical protein
MLQTFYLRLRAALVFLLLAACVYAVWAVARFRLAHPTLGLGETVRFYWRDALLLRP